MRISKTNEIFKNLKTQLKSNKDPKTVVTDDLNVIELALRYKLPILDFFYVEDTDYLPKTMEIIAEAKALAGFVYEITKAMFSTIQTKENQVGLIARIAYTTYTLDQLKDFDFIVVLDRLEIPGNVGTILRTLDSANVDALIVVDAVTKMENPKITSASRGCNLLIPTAITTYAEAQAWLLENNYDIYLGEPNLGLDYKSYEYKGKMALVVGNERFGINPNWYENKNIKVFIPMLGSNNSLNVAVATSILVYEAAMKRKK